MHAPPRADANVWTGFLCYRYELFTQKNRIIIYDLCGLRCLTDVRGEV
jgi:hypothetical protein